VVSKRPTVLIVDDEKTICDLLCEVLGEQGYVCDVALSADDALAKLKERSFDVALLDIKMPGMSGMDLLMTIGEWHRMTPIIMITAVNDANTAVEALKRGASDYIVKPFTLDEIRARIAAVLRNRKLRGDVHSTIPDTGGSDHGNNANYNSRNQMNAIAYGVNAQVDYFDFHSKIVTGKTVELARWLGLPQKQIDEWAAARGELYSERDRRIKSMLSKLERNPMAQVMLGLTRLVCQLPKSTEQQN